MQLLLLRHGDAVTHASDDASRQLSPLGEHHAQIAARTLTRLQIVPRHIFSSPFARAQQTARIIQKDLDLHEVRITEYLTPTADPRQLVQELNERSSPSALLVGHLPGLQIFASLLVSGTRQAGIRVNTGTLIAIETPPRIEYGTCELKWLLSYEQMKAMIPE